MRKYFSETVITIVLFGLIVCFVEPISLWIPLPVHMTILGVLIVLFCVYAFFIWKERSLDEREQAHHYMAGRFAYLVGGGVLLTGITVEAVSHTLDTWLPLSLGAMVLAKIAGRLWAERTH
jgi:hypothetical protein